MVFSFLRPITQARSCFQRPISSFFVREPSSSASRIVPTPLVFVSATQWDQSSSRQGFAVLAQMYSEKGYTSLDADLSLSADASSVNKMQDFESELKSVVRASFNPFPPVFFARGAACLITQTYISSNPASGLVLISPPTSNHSLLSTSLLSHALPEFDFEPKFPITIVDTPQGMANLQVAGNRLAKDDRVDRIVVNDVEGQDAFVKIEQWMDEIGI
ncbi:MAG: hypothetical protein NXY57DRAFT_886089 [Lentinula lateritia]|uniref:Serine hydrolase FSH domain-containing protein n=1 Tax=Lentinula lateritia TaxID=40482 RepID=A0ABQ8VHE7_9AGAR|nr:MAG: hypothetical protein NXY57DRAFT_886089 [Lentinula lateritia]KAJ4494369.1 hypothetical protein C8R41DRAFT_980856 [Lentinula lateritia]